jgi:hypothetical protein
MKRFTRTITTNATASEAIRVAQNSTLAPSGPTFVTIPLGGILPVSPMGSDGLECEVRDDGPVVTSASRFLSYAK